MKITTKLNLGFSITLFIPFLLTVLFSVFTKEFTAINQTAMRTFAFIGIIGGILAFSLKQLISKAIVRPILVLQRTADRVASGDYTARTFFSGYDEIGDLGTHFNTMVEQIESSMSQIAALNEILEQRVAERTQKLQETNRELSEALNQLRTTQRQLVNLEKEALEVQMAGGFAHEMRNALAGAVIMLDTVFKEGQTIAEETMGILQATFAMFHHQIPSHDRVSLIEGFAAVEHNEQQVDEVLRRVEHYVQAALQTTKLILEYAKIGKAKTGREYVNLKDLCEDILAEHHQTFQQDQIQAALTGEVFRPIKGLKNHFHSIINNLVTNARDELVNISSQNRMIEIGLREEDHVQIVTVTDNANGISEENQLRIFDPFFSTKPEAGIGLGLSFVSKLVPMYRGTIDVTSDIGKGTTFRVTFPIAEEFHEE